MKYVMAAMPCGMNVKWPGNSASMVGVCRIIVIQMTGQDLMQTCIDTLPGVWKQFFHVFPIRFDKSPYHDDRFQHLSGNGIQARVGQITVV